MNQETRRWILFIAIVMVVLMGNALLMERQQKAEMAKRRAQAAEQRATAAELPAIPGTTAPSTVTLTATPPATTPAAAETPAPIVEQGEEVVVETKSFRVRLNTAGACPVAWDVTDERFARAAETDVETALKAGRNGLKVGDFLPVEIIPDYKGLDEPRDRPLTVVLKEADGRYFNSFNERVYALERSEETDGTQVLRFVSPSTREGVRLIKIYRFPAEGFLAHLELRLESVAGVASQKIAFNDPTQPGLGLTWGPGLGHAYFVDSWDTRFFSVAAYTGTEIHSETAGKWEKAADSGSVVESFEGPLEWGAIDSRFYMAAVIPQGTRSPLIRSVVKRQNVPENERLRKNMTPPVAIEVYSDGFLLEPGESKTFQYTMFVGPKKSQLLAAIDEKSDFGLHKIMFHSNMWLIRILAVFMLHLLTWFHEMTNSYGWAIILLVLVMRLITQPLTHIGMKSQARVMAEQKRIKPLIDAINEKYKDDPQRRNQEIWKTYKEHGVNPFGMLKGCVWMLVQLPIFFALYWLLAGAIDLRGASFLWIDDLTAPDALFTLPFSLPFLGNKFNIIPILMGISQVFAQRLQSSNMQDPTQKQMATMMPIVFTAIFYNFAAGLSLYWFVSNLWQIAFQIFVNKRVQEEAEAKALHGFEERRRTQTVVVEQSSRGARQAPTKAGWRERMLEYVERRAREADEKKRTK